MPTASRAALPAPWLAARLGVDPVALEVRRRSGELIATRPPGSPDWIYPSWQFDDRGEVKPEVRRVLEAAREAGVSPTEFGLLLGRRVGLSGGRTFGGLLREGRAEPLLDALRGR